MPVYFIIFNTSISIFSKKYWIFKKN